MPQSLAKLYVHIIFSTKDRYPFLDQKNLRKEMFSYLAEIFNQYDSPALIVGGFNNHVHILCQLSKNHLITKIIGEAKRTSSKWIKSKSIILKKFHWQSGYGAFSVGQSNLESLKSYIKNQEYHHQKNPYKEEYLGFLKKYDIDYDEKYLWD